MKKISVIIPCFNCSEWVRHGWNSLKNQTIGIDEIECIFVNDASTDNGKTQHVLEEIEQEAPESVMVIALDINMRQGGARNVGMQYMSGEYMLFMDSDDLFRPETCEELYLTAKKYNADIVRFLHEMVIGDFLSEAIPLRKRDGSIQAFDLCNDDTRRAFLTGEMEEFGCTNKLYKSELIKRARSTFAEHLVYEEPKFVYPLFLYAERVVITKEKYYIWRVRTASTMTSELGKKLMEHPMVQMQLYEALTENGDVLNKYREEIQFHFFYSYYFETLCFSIINKAELPLSFYRTMQEVCQKICPDILSNKYLAKFSYLKPVAESINDSVYTQCELNYRILRLNYDTRREDTTKRIPDVKEMVEGVYYHIENTAPLLSVIMDIKGNDTEIIDAVISVSMQRFTSWELILVIEENTVNMLRVLQRLEEADHRIKVVVRNDNFRQGQNVGIEKAQGKFITFLDSSDRFSEGMLSIVSHYLANENVDVMIIPVGEIFCDAQKCVLHDNLEFIAKALPSSFVLRDNDITEKMKEILSIPFFDFRHNIYRSEVAKNLFYNGKNNMEVLLAKHTDFNIRTIGYDQRCLYYSMKQK